MPTTIAATSSVAISTFTMFIGLVLMAGSVRGAILLLKDAMKHKKFAKIIRIISAAVQLFTILGSIVMAVVIFSNMQSATARLGGVLTIILMVSILSVVTNTRGAILLFVQSSKLKGFDKWIRIICGISMIVALFSSFITGL